MTDRPSQETQGQSADSKQLLDDPRALREKLMDKPTPELVAATTREQAAFWKQRILEGDRPHRAEFLARNPKVLLDRMSVQQFDKLQTMSRRDLFVLERLSLL